MEHELEDMHNELKITRHEHDKYMKELDELHKLAIYWKHRALEKTTRKVPMLESYGSHSANK